MNFDSFDPQISDFTTEQYTYYPPAYYAYYPYYQQQPLSPTPSVEQSLHSRNIYVRGIQALNDASFLSLCKRFGNVESSKAIVDLVTNKCKGYGFVMYETQQEAVYAISQLEELGYQASFAKATATPVMGDSFTCKLKELQDENSTNLYMSNLPLSLSDDDLKALIDPHEILSLKILKDPITGLCRGVGFATRKSALQVIADLNGKRLSGAKHPLQVRFADSTAQKNYKERAAKQKQQILGLQQYYPPLEYIQPELSYPIPYVAGEEHSPLPQFHSPITPNSEHDEDHREYNRQNLIHHFDGLQI